MKKIAVVIPCYNEQDGIASVISGFPRRQLKKYGFELEVLVVDNNSKDRTTEVALAAGARVVHEPKQGKGNAIRTAFYNISEDTDYVVMCDGDDTYKAHEILRLVELLDSGFADVVIGSRMGGKMAEGSMKGFNRLGNWGFSFLIRIFYQVNVTDTLTGYFGWKRDVIVQLRQHLESTGFAIEMEMITKLARLGYRIYSVPITYEPRLGESSLRPVHDGVRIMREFMRQLKWKPRVERVAFVSDAVWPYNKGGKEKRLHEISTRLVKEGRQVDIYTMKWWNGPKTIQTSDGVYLHSISRLLPLYKDERRSIVEAVLFGLACLRLMFKKFDVIDVDSMPFLSLFSVRLVCWLKRKKMHATWHEVWGLEYWQNYIGSGPAGLLGAWSEWLSMKLPDVIISNSQHTTRRLIDSGRKKNIQTVPLGVDLEGIFVVQPHEMTSDIIFAGRLLPNKNVDLLINAIKLVKRTHPGVRCLIVGNGPERAKLEVLVDSLGLQNNVTFFNFMEDHNELYSLMKSSRMFVLPSVREGFGLVVVEANACGIPVITARHPHNAAQDLIIEGQNGYLADLTPKNFAAKIRRILREDMPATHPLEEKFSRYRWHLVAEDVEKVLVR